jgi:arginyl-tRNA--protein-N-Asp/Glu arginylyltransferase
MPEGDSTTTGSTAFTVPLQHFFRTSPLPCPYLSGRVERKLITELAGRDARRLYHDLSRAGFRRSHHLAYRPACSHCSSCLPVRVDAARFAPTRSMRRITKANGDLAWRSASPRATAEQYRLFVRYQRSRHAESDMAEMTFGDYRAMIEDSPVETKLIEFRDEQRRLVAACLVDGLDDGCSAVYSFYDPDEGRRSLGTFMVLWMIERMRAENLPFVYLGYWIAHSAKMGYKTRFRPLQALYGDGWRAFVP